MTPKFGPLLTFGLFVLCLACGQKHQTADSLQKKFRETEFIPTRGIGADGWAEARRRQLLMGYFRKQRLHFSLRQVSPSRDAEITKYRDVLLELQGRGRARPISVSIALKPAKTGAADSAFIELQQGCDKRLFSFLAALETYLDDVQAIQFLATENCLDLTTQLRLRD